MVKLVVKTALKTILAVIIALILAFGITSLAYPQGMATMFEKAQCYTAATGFSSLRYNYTHSAKDLARCAENSIKADNKKDIIKYCGKLVAHDGFKNLCEKRDAESNVPGFSYRQFIYGNLACSQYQRGDKVGAINSAVSALTDGFPVNNAFAILTIEVADARDGETAQKLLSAMEQLEDKNEYYNTVKTVLEDTIN